MYKENNNIEITLSEALVKAKGRLLAKDWLTHVFSDDEINTNEELDFLFDMPYAEAFEWLIKHQREVAPKLTQEAYIGFAYGKYLPELIISRITESKEFKESLSFFPVYYIPGDIKNYNEEMFINKDTEWFEEYGVEIDLAGIHQYCGLIILKNNCPCFVMVDLEKNETEDTEKDIYNVIFWELTGRDAPIEYTVETIASKAGYFLKNTEENISTKSLTITDIVMALLSVKQGRAEHILSLANCDDDCDNCENYDCPDNPAKEP